MELDSEGYVQDVIGGEAHYGQEGNEEAMEVVSKFMRRQPQRPVVSDEAKRETH